uniref:Ig-like domain-containing protein n=1 Tax=Denticeps clupeoides TaxID=299321 RepID=A0AAY4DII1_9TELE
HVSLFFCSLVVGAVSSEVTQPVSVVTADAGNTVSMTCPCPEHEMNVWMVQPLGEKPRSIISSYSHDQPPFLLSHFQQTGRFSAVRGRGSSNLTISRVETADSAVYYCVAMSLNDLTFGDGTLLIVKGTLNGSDIIKQLPAPESFIPGDDVTLNCTVVSGGCAGEHSVYWFRHGTPGSHPGIIYTHGDRSAGCEKNPEAGSSTQSCVYHLPKRSLSTTDAGTYYCAVAACGRILFGNGTDLNIEALFLSVIVNVVLAIQKKRRSDHSTGNNLRREKLLTS